MIIEFIHSFILVNIKRKLMFYLKFTLFFIYSLHKRISELLIESKLL